jgi:DNA-binding IclR family transcriptional regulator
MTSLIKVFAIIEYVARKNGVCVTPSEVAAHTELNIASCTRIMGELVKHGYLLKISRREGYCTGPMVFSLAQRPSVYSELAEIARPLLTEFALKIKMPVNLSVLHENKRIMILIVPPVEAVKEFKNYFRFEDFFETATGRLLLATAPQNFINDFLAKYHDQRTQILKMLNDVKRLHEVDFKNPENTLRIQGQLMIIKNYPPAAFGYGISCDPHSKLDADEILQQSRRIAKQITKQLSNDSCLLY